MQFFTKNQSCKTYKTQAKAIKANNPEALEKYRWIMATTPEGRYHIVFMRNETGLYGMDNDELMRL